MTLTITIRMDGAAFGETEYERGAECARILENAGRMLAEEGPGDSNGAGLYDSNGNRVGMIVVAAE